MLRTHSVLTAAGAAAACLVPAVSLAQGQMLWRAQFTASNTNGNNVQAHVAVDGSRNVFVGFGWEPSSGTEETTLIKYSQAGAQLWLAHYAISGVNLYLAATKADASGSAFLVIRELGTAPATDVVKFDASGSRLWVRRFAAQGGAQPLSAAVDAAGNIYVAGRVYSTDGSQWGEMFLASYDPSGATRWIRYAGAQGALPEYWTTVNLLLDPSGNPIISGPTVSDSGGVVALIAQYSPAGNPAWQRYYYATEQQVSPSYMAPLPAGGVVIGLLELDRATSAALYRFVEYSSSGTKALDITQTRGLGPIAVNGAGDFYTSVSQAVPNAFGVASYKYYADGQANWRASVTSGNDFNDTPVAIMVAGDGTVVVAGTFSVTGGRTEMFVFKYTHDGELIWSHQWPYKELSATWVTCQDAAVDPSGNVIVVAFWPWALPMHDEIFVTEYAP